MEIFSHFIYFQYNNGSTFMTTRKENHECSIHYPNNFLKLLYQQSFLYSILQPYTDWLLRVCNSFSPAGLSYLAGQGNSLKTRDRISEASFMTAMLQMSQSMIEGSDFKHLNIPDECLLASESWVTRCQSNTFSAPN